MDKQEINLSEKREKLRKDIDYLFKRINWKESFMDAKAIKIMNEFWKDLVEADKEFININSDDFNKLADNLPKETNHNFNRNNIISLIKNQVLIMKKRAGDKLKCK